MPGHPLGKEVRLVDSVITLIVALVAGAVGAGLGFMIKQRNASDQAQVAMAGVEQSRVIAEAEQKAILLEAKEEAIRVRTQAEAEAREQRSELQGLERRLHQKEENLDRK